MLYRPQNEKDSAKRYYLTQNVWPYGSLESPRMESSFLEPLFSENVFILHFVFGFKCFSVPMVCITVLYAVSSVIVWSSVTGPISASGIDSPNVLNCNKKMYTFRVSNTDNNGRTCSDEINVMSCWGRCDSNEVQFVITNSCDRGLINSEKTCK